MPPTAPHTAPWPNGHPGQAGGPWRGQGTELLSRGELQAGGGCSPWHPAAPELPRLRGAAAAPSDPTRRLMWKDGFTAPGHRSDLLGRAVWDRHRQPLQLPPGMLPRPHVRHLCPSLRLQWETRTFSRQLLGHRLIY